MTTVIRISTKRKLTVFPRIYKLAIGKAKCQIDIYIYHDYNSLHKYHLAKIVYLWFNDVIVTIVYLKEE